MGASSAGDTFKRLRPGVTVDLRYYRIVDMLVAKRTPEVDKQAATLVSDPAQGPGILGTARRPGSGRSGHGGPHRPGGKEDRPRRFQRRHGLSHAVDQVGRRPGGARDAEAGRQGDLVFSERTAFEVVPIN